MLSLKEWIEAQLKRGYSRKRIKSALIRKGYSPKAVAEVDKIPSSSLSRQQNRSKKQSPNKSVIVILLIAALFATWLFAAPFLSKQAADSTMQEQKSRSPSREEIAIEETIPPPEQIESKSTGELCGQYPKVPTEISCFEAVGIANSKYSGNIISVRRIGLEGNETLWDIEMRLSAPIELNEIVIKENARVIIDAMTSQVISVRPVSK